MKKAPLFLLLLSAQAAFAELPGFEQRKQILLQGLSQNTLSATSIGKYGLPVCLAKLHLAKSQDTETAAAAAEYLAVHSFKSIVAHPDWGNEGDPFFAWIGMVRGYYLYKNRLAPHQVDSLRHTASSFRRWFKGDLSIYPDHTNPVVAGTENHHFMTWTSLYLWAQAWPDASWYRDNVSSTMFTSAEAMAEVRKLLIERGRKMYAFGNSEFLSSTYEIFHLIPMINLWEFATDPEVRNIAYAYLCYYWSSLSVNLFETHLTGPAARSYGTQGNLRNLAISQFIAWLYFGYGNPGTDEIYTKNDGGRYCAYLALSDWRPEPLFNRIIMNDASFPIWSREVKSFWDANPPRYAMKSTFRDSLYITSMANMRTQPEYYVIDDNQFEIAWKSSDPYNWLQCSHPYWYSDQGEDYWRSSSSPFQQVVHHKNAAIVLFNIPKEDPYRKPGWNTGWISNRDGHFSGLLQLGQVRFPAAIDEVVESGGWFFLREGDVFIAVKPLGGQTEVKTSGDWKTIKNRGAKVGFIFETGTKTTAGSFAAFREKVIANKLFVDMAALDISYTSCAGDSIRILFNQSARIPDCSVPQGTINGSAVDYVNWPVMENGYMRIKDYILSASDGSECIRVDWRSDIPVISKSGCVSGIKRHFSTPKGRSGKQSGKKTAPKLYKQQGGLKLLIEGHSRKDETLDIRGRMNHPSAPFLAADSK